MAAFGPATNDLEQTLLALLQGQAPSPLAPVPLAPMGGIGALSFDTTAAQGALQPQPVPPALPGPVDAEAIRSQFAGMAGPEPVAPTVEPTSMIIRIARALQGFGAGVQGQGPQFLAGLREEAEAPQREFRARKERFDARKQDLAVAGEQAVLTAEDRRAQRTQSLLDKQADRDFEESIKRSGFKSQEAIAQMRAAFDLERDAKKAEFERQEQERKDAKELKKQIIDQANVMSRDFKVSREEALRFADHEISGTPLSKADAKTYSRIEKYRPSPVGTGAAQPKVMVEIENTDGSLSVVPYSAVGSAVSSGQITKGPRGIFIEGQPSKPAPSVPMGFPEFSGAMQRPAAPSAQPGVVFTRAEVEANAKKNKLDPKQLEADIRARGGVIR